MNIEATLVHTYPKDPKFITRLTFKTDDALKIFERFLLKRQLLLQNAQTEMFRLIAEKKLAYMVSFTNGVQNNQVVLDSVICAPFDAQGDFNEETDLEYLGQDAFAIVARWKPSFSAQNFANDLNRAHERNLRQIDYYFQNFTYA